SGAVLLASPVTPAVVRDESPAPRPPAATVPDPWWNRCPALPHAAVPVAPVRPRHRVPRRPRPGVERQAAEHDRTESGPHVEWNGRRADRPTVFPGRRPGDWRQAVAPPRRPHPP